MRKGILFLGCSYTWGEGLYFYSDLDDLPFHENHMFDSENMRETFHAYRKKYRFARQVADQLDTWEYTSEIGNGGKNFQLYYFVVIQELMKGNMRYEDFDTFVWQLSEPMRDFPGGNEKLHNFYTTAEELDDAMDTHLKREIDVINKCCRDWEDRGVKVVLLSWPNDYINSRWANKEFKDRYCYINYNDKTYDSISDLYNKNENVLANDGKTRLCDPPLTIQDDFFNLGYQKNDRHLNKFGNKIVADSIVKKIKEYE